MCHDVDVIGALLPTSTLSQLKASNDDLDEMFQSTWGGAFSKSLRYGSTLGLVQVGERPSTLLPAVVGLMVVLLLPSHHVAGADEKVADAAGNDRPAVALAASELPPGCPACCHCTGWCRHVLPCAVFKLLKLLD